LHLKHAILAIAKAIGLFRTSKRLTAKKIRVLAYHGVWLGEGHFGNFLYMSADKFQHRMALLKSWGYPVVSLNDALNNRENGNLPPCATVITIDDGWYSTYLHIVPALKSHDYPATIYLTTYYCQNQAPVIDVALQYCFYAEQTATLYMPDYTLGPLPIGTPEEREIALKAALGTANNLESDAQKQAFLEALCGETGVNYGALMSERWFHLMTPEEVKIASESGVTIELHTHHHRITHEGKDCLREELRLNGDMIRSITGQDPMHFCYPSGKFSPGVWPTLSSTGIKSATTTDIGLVDGHSPAYALPRILDGQQVSDLEFEAEMSGFMDITRQVRNIFRSTT